MKSAEGADAEGGALDAGGGTERAEYGRLTTKPQRKKKHACRRLDLNEDKRTNGETDLTPKKSKAHDIIIRAVFDNRKITHPNAP